MMNEVQIRQRDDVLLRKETKLKVLRIALAVTLIIWVIVVFIVTFRFGIRGDGAELLLITFIVSYSLGDCDQKLKHIQSIKLYRNELEKKLKSGEQ